MVIYVYIYIYIICICIYIYIYKERDRESDCEVKIGAWPGGNNRVKTYKLCGKKWGPGQGVKFR